VDNTGYLSEFNLLSPQSIGGSKRAEQLKDERDENITKLEEVVYARDNNQIPLTSKELAEQFDKTSRTIINWACKSEKLRVENVGTVNFIVPLNWK
jgi:hypothetical protein